MKLPECGAMVVFPLIRTRPVTDVAEVSPDSVQWEKLPLSNPPFWTSSKGDTVRVTSRNCVMPLVRSENPRLAV